MLSSLRRTLVRAIVVAPVLAAAASAAHAQTPVATNLSTQVEVIRTAYGVPHIRAGSLKAAFYALAWLQIEDHGPDVAIGLLRARGEMGRWFGRDSMEGDFFAKRAYALAIDHYADLDQATRDAYEGFAAGANRYIQLHPEQFPAGFAPHFTGYDIAARDVNVARASQARQFLARRGGGARRATADVDTGEGELFPKTDAIEEGSNAWAFAPSRTKSGRAILLRNPHLNWNAGYYEAQMTVAGVVDFYGDFRIGGPFGVIGGFNRWLGWATTNNAPDLEEIYALEADPHRADHYLFDGATLPLERDLVTVTFRNGDALSTETREFWRTSLGPVIERDSGRIYILKAAGEGDWRGGEQFLHMMRAQSLDQWKEAMRMRARVTSNFTYADRAGNILYVWNASLPALPHPNGGDTTAVAAAGMADVWTRYVPWDSLPQMLNPRGGYVHNENDAPYYANMRQPLDPSRYVANRPLPALRLRSQLAIALIDNDRKLSLEDVTTLKHSYRMLLADRVKDDLIAAVRASQPTGDVAGALDLITRWNNTAAPNSRGAVLFDHWWRKYTERTNPDTMFAEQWSESAPASTPRGLRDGKRAADAFAWAVEETARRFGAWDVPWGDVHRVRRGSVDVPVGGCGGALGCFRVLNFRTDPDGRRSAIGGDGWVLAVEFTDTPRAYSVLAYGESDIEGSPYHADQAAMFAKGEMKRVAFTEKDVDEQATLRFRPGSSE